MGLYERYVFPWLLERTNSAALQSLRAKCLASASGRTLEIGLGTGLTLPHYPPGVTELVAVEPSHLSSQRLHDRLASSPVPVQLVKSSGEGLPFEEESFDSVVIALVLCSVREPKEVIQEARRVLKPGGVLHFLEHVRSKEPRHQLWQDRLTPIHKLIGCGCHLNRDTEPVIVAQGFEITSLERHRVNEMPMSPLFPFIVGTALKRG